MTKRKPIERESYETRKPYAAYAEHEENDRPAGGGGGAIVFLVVVIVGLAYALPHLINWLIYIGG